MSKSEPQVSMDQLLDGTVDDLADAPEFRPFPIGTHRCQFHFEPKSIDDVGSGVEVKLTAIETVEMPEDSTEAPLEAGATTNVFLFFTHQNKMVAEFGQGTFKMFMAELAEKFGKNTNRALMEQGQGCEGLFVTGRRTNKEKTQQFTSIEKFKLI